MVDLLDGITSIDDTLEDIRFILSDRLAPGAGGGDNGGEIIARPPDSVVSSLVTRNGWHYDVIQYTEEELDAGETLTFLDESDETGVITTAFLSAVGDGAEDTNIRLKTDRFTIEGTIEQQYNLGFTSETAQSTQEPAVIAHDTTNDIYSILFSSPNGYHWTDTATATVNAPSDGDGITVTIRLVKVVIDDMEAFTYGLAQ